MKFGVYGHVYVNVFNLRNLPSGRVPFACAVWPGAKWRHFAPGLEVERRGRSQTFGLIRPVRTRKGNTSIRLFPPSFVKSWFCQLSQICLQFSVCWICFVVFPVHPCASNPCVHNGQCLENGDDYTCVCFRGTTGRHCETCEFEMALLKVCLQEAWSDQQVLFVELAGHT